MLIDRTQPHLDVTVKDRPSMDEDLNRAMGHLLNSHQNEDFTGSSSPVSAMVTSRSGSAGTFLSAIRASRTTGADERLDDLGGRARKSPTTSPPS